MNARENVRKWLIANNADELLNAYRAEVLREAADELDSLPLSGVEAGVRDALSAEVRRMADEATGGGS